MDLTENIRLVRELGRGGMGTVWLAEHAKLGDVVVKVLTDGMAGETSRSRFLREAATAKQVEGPHVVRIFDYGVTESGAPFIVMERLRGHDLGHEIRKRGQLPPAFVASVLDQLGIALAAAHERGIIHRDVKPANVFLCDGAEDEPLVKLLDFGIAKMVDADMTLTSTGDVLGSPLYMSPEQLEGSRDIDTRADVWAMGVLAFLALTGKPPFRGDTLAQLVTKVLFQAHPVPSEIEPALPTGFDAWFAKACAKSATDRFASAREAAEAFAVAMKTSAHGRARMPSRPPPATPTIQGLGATLTVTSMSEAGRREEQKPRKRGALFGALGLLGVGALIFAYRTATPHAAPAGSRAPKGIAIGRSHTCTIMADATLRCWGANADGELGVGDRAPRLAPAPVKNLSNVFFTALGPRHTCAATGEGRLFCWGSNTKGQLGDGTTTSRAEPTQVLGLGPVKKVQCGDEHTCAEMKDGTALCWGSNASGELGDGTTVDRLAPTAVQGLRGVRKLSIGAGRHACASLASGSVMCWGVNARGQLGVGGSPFSATPVAVPGLTGASKVYVGLEHSCALAGDGTVWCWGANDRGQLGDGTTTSRDTPAQVSGLASVDNLGSGFRHTCAVLSSGATYCWGANDHGQLGIGVIDAFRASAVPIPELATDILEVATKGEHSCALGHDGALRCWGSNDEGQLGDGTRESRAKPTVVSF